MNTLLLTRNCPLRRLDCPADARGTPPRVRRLILPLLCFGFSSCSAAAGAPTLRLSSGQDCIATEPDPRATDVTALLSSRLGFPAAGNPSPFDTLLVFVEYDSTGVLDRVAAFDRPGRSAVPREVVTALREALTSSADPGTFGWGLLVAQGQPRLVPHHPAVECRPQLLNPGELRQMLLPLAANPAAFNRTAVVMVFVDQEGRVSRGQIERSTGSFEVDRQMLEIAQRARIAPALRDGFAIPVWISFPLRVGDTPR